MRIDQVAVPGVLLLAVSLSAVPRPATAEPLTRPAALSVAALSAGAVSAGAATLGAAARVAGPPGLATTLPAAAAASAPRPASAEAYPRPANGVFRVIGHGFGHGRGLSQFGAHGAAIEGRSATQILDFYYPGTATGVLGAGSQIRVRLLAVPANAVTVTGAANLRVRDRATNVVTTLGDYAAAARYRVVATASALQVQHSANGGGTWTVVTAGVGPMAFEGPATIRVLLPGGISRGYEGTVAGVRTAPTTVAAVNTLQLERYLAGVVPREMPASWLPAALQSQAVAARTYALYERVHAARTSPWDICDTTACQVYGGRWLYAANGTPTDLEPARSTAAVAATAGRIRTWLGDPILAQYSSSDGGWTVGDPALPYLPTRSDWFDAIGNPLSSWTYNVAATRLQACLPAIGTLDQIAILSRDAHGDWGGRVGAMRLTGHAAGQPTLVTTTGAVFRRCAGLPSNYFTVTSGFTQTVSPGAVRDPASGRVDLATTGPHNALYWRRFVPGHGWLAWRALGGVVFGPPSVVRRPDGSAQAWFRGAGNHLYTAGVSASGAFLGWHRWGGAAASTRPCPVLLPDRSTLVFYRGTDGALWYGAWTPGLAFAGWRSLGGALAPGAGPAAAVTGPGAITVAALGTSGAVYLRAHSRRGWSGWRSIGGGSAGDLAAAYLGSGVVEVYARAPGTNSLRAASLLRGAFGGWRDLGGALAAGPSATAAYGRAELLVLGATGGAYHRTRTATWGPYLRLPA
jgi:SpoIID/LytB domain protein